MTLDNIKQIFELIGGLGMFLYGMKLMADGLQKTARGRMKKRIASITEKPLSGILLGTLVTALIQSSSATTVMIVGFVNAGLLSLSQSVGLIMGANIGTTITAWMVSMNEWGEALRPEFFAPVLLGIGAFLLLFSQKGRLQMAGTILVGFGLLFTGLSFMSESIRPWQNSPVFRNLFFILGKNPLSGILVGMVATALIQSSSASIGILQTLASSGSISWSLAVYLTLGQNIGTCITALLASAGTVRTAKQAAVIHLLFNIVGVVCFGSILFFLFCTNKDWAQSSITSTQISIFHTVFNLGTTLLLLPFTKTLAALSEKLVKKERPAKINRKSPS